MSAWPTTLTGQFYDSRDGSNYNAPLGTLASFIILDRNAQVNGPTPVDIGGGQFTLDLSSYSGFNIVVRVTSTAVWTQPFIYSDGNVIAKAAEATSLADGINGRFCTKTRMWVPAHRVKKFLGAPYFDIFCPTAITNTFPPKVPGIQQVSSETV